MAPAALGFWALAGGDDPERPTQARAVHRNGRRALPSSEAKKLIGVALALCSAVRFGSVRFGLVLAPGAWRPPPSPPTDLPRIDPASQAPKIHALPLCHEPYL